MSRHIEVRIIGLPDGVETITRELRRQFTVVAERDRDSRKNPEFIRRYLTIQMEVAHDSQNSAGAGIR